MKLYKRPDPIILMHINIRKQLVQTEHLTIVEVGQQELLEWLRSLIEKEGLSIFLNGYKTTIEVREGEGKRNGKVISFSFRGLEPLQVKELILNNLTT